MHAFGKLVVLLMAAAMLGPINSASAAVQTASIQYLSTNLVGNTCRVTATAAATGNTTDQTLNPMGGPFWDTVGMRLAEPGVGIYDDEFLLIDVGSTQTFTPTFVFNTGTAGPLQPGAFIQFQDVTNDMDPFSGTLLEFRPLSTNEIAEINAICFTMVDTKRPKVDAIIGMPSTVSAGQSIKLIVEFSEPVIAFSPGDIQAVNASVNSVNPINPSTFEVFLTVTDPVFVSAQVIENGALDLDGNGNLPSFTVSTADIASNPGRAQSKIKKSVQNNFVANQPNLTPLLSQNGGPGSQFIASVDSEAGNLQVEINPRFSSWLRLTGTWSDIDGIDTHYLLGSFGTHRIIANNLILGGLVEFDSFDQDYSGNEFEGQGYLVGPYIVGRFADAPIFYEGRLLFGRSSTDFTLTNGATGSYDSDRILSMFAVEGVKPTSFGELRPKLKLVYSRDTADAFTDSADTPYPSQTTTYARAEAGLDAVFPLDLGFESAALTLGTSAVYSVQDSDLASENSETYRRLRMDSGLSISPSLRSSITTSVFYEGIGESNFEQYGLDFRLEFFF